VAIGHHARIRVDKHEQRKYYEKYKKKLSHKATLQSDLVVEVSAGINRVSAVKYRKV
jgi:hypothetical protein